MRIISFLGPEGAATWGVLQGANGAQGVVSRAQLGEDAPATVQALVAQGAAQPAWLAQLAGRAAALPVSSLTALTLLPVLPAPGKIICLGVNYHDHAKEGGNTVA